MLMSELTELAVKQSMMMYIAVMIDNIGSSKPESVGLRMLHRIMEESIVATHENMSVRDYERLSRIRQSMCERNLAKAKAIADSRKSKS